MNSKSVYLLFLVITSCSTTPLLWETAGGAKASEEKLIAAKSACDYDKKYAERRVYERQYRNYSNMSGIYFGGDLLDDDLEIRMSDLADAISQVENEVAECMRQQGLVQRTTISNP